MKSEFVKIEDTCVINIWFCPECGKKAEITPDWYQNNGTPMCSDCDEDMEYNHTEVKI